MFFSKKASAVVLSMLVIAMAVTTGCGQKRRNEWVNTKSMPGQTFTQYANAGSSSKKHNSTVVYLGDDDSPNVNFGPRDVSFRFKDLK